MNTMVRALAFLFYMAFLAIVMIALGLYARHQRNKNDPPDDDQ